MGKHSAPAPPAKAQIPVAVRVISHHAVHCVTIITLHVVALGVLGYMNPVLMFIGIMPGTTAH